MSTRNVLLIAILAAAPLTVAPWLARAQESGSHMPTPPPIPKQPTMQDETSSSDNEVDVYLWDKAIGSQDVNALLIGQTVYLQPFDVFNFIHVKADASADGSKLSGFYIDPERTYTFDNTARSITYQEQVTNFAPDEYIIRSDGAYLRADMFEKIFNLQCIFSFRSLSVQIKSGEPLPAESEAKYASARNSISSYANPNEKPDAIFDLPRPLFSLGVLDYNAATSYTAGQPLRSANSQYQLFAGGQLFGGDMDATVAGQSGVGVNWASLPWQWRYSVQNSSLVRRILIGREDPLFTAMQLPDTMVGFEVSNINTDDVRTSYANYVISDHTQPDWTVELYVNDALVNYTKADQTGYYKFVVPLSYGSTDIKLKFYGPYGEVRTSVMALQIPYTFLRPGEFQYTLTGGTSINHPGIKSSTGQLDTKLGISSHMTVGGGIRYITYPGITNGNLNTPIGEINYIPYGSGSLSLTSDLLLSGEYYYGSGYRARFSYTVPAGVAMQGEYDKPVLPTLPTQNSLPANTLNITNPFLIQDQRQLSVSTPLPFGLGSFRVQGTDIPINTDSGNLSLSPEALVSILGYPVSVSANGTFLRDLWRLYSRGDVNGTIDLSLMKFGAIIRPGIMVDYTTRTVQSAQVQIMEPFGKLGNFQLSASHGFQGGGNSIQLSFHTLLPDVEVGMSTGFGAGQPVSSSATVSGSVGYDPSIGIYASNRPGVRRGGIEVIPYLDENQNGIWDEGEPIVPKFGFERPPGQVTVVDSGILRYDGMQPYKSYFLKTSTAGLDNISLVPKFNTFDVTPAANGFTKIEIPLASAGQIDGYIMNKHDSSQDPVGGVRLKIRHWNPGVDTSELKLTEDLLSYSNGEYYYEGILPGTYRIFVDPNQLHILHAVSEPPYIDFTIKSTQDGDVEEGLNFSIVKLSAMRSKEQVDAK